ncbi:oligosaccharide flippase family protein [Aquimarina sp. SS2-1]|uniref:oligosaccharide flippase family protein n=1 Tax=Aquimarina besae TaxID=3342247 RepID=UPI00366C9363
MNSFKEKIDTSHKTILKTLTLFGSTHIFNMLINVFTVKFTAIFLGASGLGVLGLVKNTLEIIKSVSSFGLNLVAVREISSIDSNDNNGQIETLYIIRKIAFYTGLFGAILSIIFSTILSKWTFGSSDNFYWFVGLSGYYIIVNMTTYRESILQGFRLLRKIIVVNLISSGCIALITVVLYFLLGIQGIVPVIVTGSLIKWMICWYYTRTFTAGSFKMDKKVLWIKMKPLLSLGLLLSLNVILGKFCSYLIKVYLNTTEDSAVLGYYEAGIIILISYLGIIFSTMSIDFYPRLTAIQGDHSALKEFVNNQIEMAVLIVTPAILLFYWLDEWFIQILYTKDLLQVVEILKIGLLSVLIRAIIWPLGFVLLAKGDRKYYFFSEVLGDFLNVVVTIVFYELYGLLGIGAALVLNYTIYGVVVYFYIHKQYKFTMMSSAKTVIISFILGGLGCFLKLDNSLLYSHWVALLIFAISIFYSGYLLNKRINFFDFIRSKL